MPAHRKKNRGLLSRVVRSLSLLAAAFLIAGAVFLLTSKRAYVPAGGGQASDIETSQQPSASRRIHKPGPAPTVPEPTNTGHKAPAAPRPTDRDRDAAPPAPQRPRLDARPARPPPSHVQAGSWAEVTRGSEYSPKIALTFDAGWESKPTTPILDALARHGIRCTFFLRGRWIENNKDLTRRIAAEGHEIGNHTYSHRRLTNLSRTEIVREAQKVEELVLELTGRSTKPLLRVPYGARDRRVLGVLKQEGYRSIYWHVDSWDGFKRGITAAEVAKRVLDRVENGSIVLMHCGSKATADALDDLIDKLISAGYQPVTVGELLESPEAA